MDIKRILIHSALDELSTKVTSFAVDLAEQMNISEIILLNLIIPIHAQAFTASGDGFAMTGHMANPFNVLLMEKNKKLAGEEVERFSTGNVRIKPFVRFNESETDLNKFMQEFETDIVVCGSRDEHSFLHLLFGSGTESIVRRVDYPVIILQDETKAGDIQNILLAIDINIDNKSGLREIAAFAKALNAGLQLLHVLSNDSQSSDLAIKKLHNLAIENMLDNYDINVVNNDSVEDGIRSFARKHNPDMIAVLSQGKGRIHKLIFGSSTEEIIKETNKPVFVSKIS